MKIISIAPFDAREILRTDEKFLSGGHIYDICEIFEIDKYETLSVDGNKLVYECDEHKTTYECFFTTEDSSLPVQQIPMPKIEKDLKDICEQSDGPVYILEKSGFSNTQILYVVCR